MIKFGNTFVNYEGTYFNDYVSQPSWVNVYSPTSGLFPGSGVGVIEYNNYIPSALNYGEKWLDGTQDVFSRALYINYPDIGTANLNSNVQINLTEEMKAHDDYLLVNYCSAPMGVSNVENAYYTSLWGYEFGINDEFKTTLTAMATRGYAIKPDNQKAVSAYSVGVNGSGWYNHVLFGVLQYYFPNYSRDVKKFRFLIDMKNGNYSGYMTSSMLQDMSNASYRFTSSCNPITLGETMNLSLKLNSPETVTTGNNWRYAGWLFGGFSMSAYRGPIPTEQEILSL